MENHGRPGSGHDRRSGRHRIRQRISGTNRGGPSQPMRRPPAPVRCTIQPAIASMAQSMASRARDLLAPKNHLPRAKPLHERRQRWRADDADRPAEVLFNDGDKGPPTPPGIRMHGIFAASTGFSAQFFPESVILGCGPDSARAYPYTVVADGTKSGHQNRRARSPADSRLPSRRLARCRLRPLSGSRTHRRRPERQRRLHVRSNGADLQPCRSRPEQNDPVGRRRCEAMIASAGSPRNLQQLREHVERRRQTLHSSRAAGQRHSVHRLRISRAAWRSESARRASLRASARQLRRTHSRKAASPSRPGMSPYKYVG